MMKKVGHLDTDIYQVLETKTELKGQLILDLHSLGDQKYIFK